MTEVVRYTLSSGRRVLLLRLMFLGALAVFLGLLFAPGRTWLDLLVNGFCFLSLAVTALFFIATQRLSGARWSAGLRRIPEALTSATPIGALLMFMLFFGRHWIYPWSVAVRLSHGSQSAGRVEYLRVPFVFARMAVVLLSWVFLGWLFRRTSLKQDFSGDLKVHRSLNQQAALFVVVFALSFTIGSFDWLISLEPQWFSTIYAIYVFSGCFVQTIAAITLAVVVLRERHIFAGFGTEEQLHDLGRLLFAFSTFWAYIWFSQYLLIWYGNLPDEVVHYIRRTNGPWLYFFVVNLIVNWAIPFALLISQRGKRTPKILMFVSILLLCGHWLDVFLLVMPSAESVPKFGVLEVSIAAGYGGLFTYIFLRSLAAASIVPLQDPLLEGPVDAEIDRPWAGPGLPVGER